MMSTFLAIQYLRFAGFVWNLQIIAFISVWVGSMNWSTLLELLMTSSLQVIDLNVSPSQRLLHRICSNITGLLLIWLTWAMWVITPFQIQAEFHRSDSRWGGGHSLQVWWFHRFVQGSTPSSYRPYQGFWNARSMAYRINNTRFFSQCLMWN